MVPVRGGPGNHGAADLPARADSPMMARRVKARSHHALPDQSAAAPSARTLLALVALGAIALPALFVLLGFLYSNVPSGWTPSLGFERDVTGLFPGFWHRAAFTLPADSTAPVIFGARARPIMSGLWLIYALTGALVLKLPRSDQGRALRIVALSSVLCHAVLVLMPPVATGDLFHYALFGRMVSHYGLNPYVTTAARLRDDPLWPYASWNFLTTHYGPSFTYLSAAVTGLTGSDVLWTAIGFKTLAALMNLASCWLVRNISAHWERDDGVGAFALYALNPLVLFETAGMGHNEAVVVAFALGGIALGLSGRPWLAIVALLLSADVKTVTASVALFFAAWFIHHAAGSRARARRAAGVVALGAALMLALWAPFWAGMSTFNTTRAILAKGPELKLAAPEAGVSTARLALFGALVVGCAVAAMRGSISRVLSLGAAVGIVFLLAVFPWSLSWYALPPFALAIAARRTRANLLLLIPILGYGILFMQRYVALRPL
jgi:hypothetical protein